MSFSNAKIVAKSADPVLYRAQPFPRGNPQFIMSSSPLRDFDHCPRRWVNGYESAESKSTDWGSLLDTRFLTPDQFDKRYLLRPETYRNDKGEVKDWSNNANVCKAWNSQAEKDGKIPVNRSELDEVDKAIKRLLDDEIIASWHAASDRQVWVQADWTDIDTGIVIPCQCLIDYVPRPDTEYCKALGDLKSARSGSRAPWPRHVYRYGYHIQGAFDLDMYVAATGEDRVSWCWVGQENYPPYEPFKRMMSDDFLAMGRNAYQRALKRYALCLKRGKWFGYDDHVESLQGWTLVQPEAYMGYEELSANMEPLPQEEDDLPPEDVVP